MQHPAFWRYRRLSNRAADRPTAGGCNLHSTDWRRHDGQAVLAVGPGHSGAPAKPRPAELGSGESSAGNKLGRAFIGRPEQVFPIKPPITASVLPQIVGGNW